MLLILLLFEAIVWWNSIDARTSYQLQQPSLKSGRADSNIEIGRSEIKIQSAKLRLCRNWDCTILVLEHGNPKSEDSIGTLDFHGDGTWVLSDSTGRTNGEWKLNEISKGLYLIMNSNNREGEFNMMLLFKETTWGIELRDTRHIPHFVDIRWRLVPSK